MHFHLQLPSIDAEPYRIWSFDPVKRTGMKQDLSVCLYIFFFRLETKPDSTFLRVIEQRYRRYHVDIGETITKNQTEH